MNKSDHFEILSTLKDQTPNDIFALFYHKVRTGRDVSFDCSAMHGVSMDTGAYFCCSCQDVRFKSIGIHTDRC